MKTTALSTFALLLIASMSLAGGANGPDPIPTIQILIGNGVAPSFDLQTWGGWSNMDEPKWSDLCHWIAEVAGGDGDSPWPSTLEW